MEEQKKEFTGVWIPRHILEDIELSWTEIILYSEIASFNLCYKKLDQLAKRCRLESKESVSRLLANLIKKGYIKKVGFDGRKNYFKAVLDNPNELRVDVGDQGRVDENVNPDLTKKSTHSYIDNIRENKYIVGAEATDTSSPPKRQKTATRKTNVPKEVKHYTEDEFEQELAKMEATENSHLDIIASFLREKNIIYENSKQLGLAIKRHCKPASELSGAFTNDQIFKAMSKLQQDYKKEVEKGKSGNPIDWTLETVLKMLTK